jgi:hypothetical protein
VIVEEATDVMVNGIAVGAGLSGAPSGAKGGSAGVSPKKRHRYPAQGIDICSPIVSAATINAAQAISTNGLLVVVPISAQI